MNPQPNGLTASEMIRLAELAERLRNDSVADAEVAELDSMLAGSGMP